MKPHGLTILALGLLAGCATDIRPRCAFTYTADIKQKVQDELGNRLGDNIRLYNTDTPVETISGRYIQLLMFPIGNPDRPYDRVIALNVDPCTGRVMVPRN